MVKSDLNISNVLLVLEKENYKYHNLPLPYGMISSVYNKIIKELLDTFFDYKVNELEIDEEFYQLPNKSGKIYLKEKNIHVENGYKLEFNALYPNIIIKLWKSGAIKFNINEFGILFSFLLENYNNVKKLNISYDTIKLWKTIINYTYGALNNIHGPFVELDYIHMITLYMNNFYDKLIKNHSSIILYVDVDVIYLDFIKKELIEDIKKLNLPFELKPVSDFFIIDKKKVISIENGEFKSSGFKNYKSEHQVEKDRISKINKLKNVFNRNINDI